MNILGCEVPISTLETWVRFFVFNLEPVFLTREAQEFLPMAVWSDLVDQMRLIPRRDFAATLEYRDAYLTYLIPKEAEFVALLEAQDFRAFPRDVQESLIQLQIQFGRGQIYDLEFVHGVLGEIQTALEPDIFAERFVLHFDTWNAFSTEVRHRWIAAYVSLDHINCLSSLMPENTWAELPEQVRALAGTFSSTSGANCFATVIAGLTPDLLESTRIAKTWMLEHEFLEALETRGFHDAGKLELPVKPNSVITWLNSSRTNIHACLMLEFGLVLNKDAQSWFAPRQILKLEDLLKSWAADASEVRVWN
jgi:hypothetical protein